MRRKWISQALLLFLCLSFAVGVLVFIIGGYGFGWTWTGLGESPHSDAINPAKTFWDWMQLLIVPFALAVATLWFGRQQNERDQQITEDREQAAVLEAYFDKIGELMLANHLRTSHDQDEVRQIAHARTVAALSRLNPARKQVLLHFLHDAELFGKGSSLVSMEGANLSETKLSVSSTTSESDFTSRYLIDASYEGAQLEGADLSRAQLEGADLSRASLKDAKLQGAFLAGANLSDADLRGADLRDADLSYAKLCRAKLLGANFKGANLTSANLQDVEEGSYNLFGQIEHEAKSLHGAIMNDGSRHA